MIMKDLISFQAKETARITEQVIIRKMIKDRKMKKNKPKDKKNNHPLICNSNTTELDLKKH